MSAPRRRPALCGQAGGDGSPAARRDAAGAAQEAGISDESLEAYRRQLQPKVLALFGSDDVSSIPRPELALRIGNLLTHEVERSGAKLGLLQRRKLVASLIDWLLQCSAMQPDERQEGRPENDEQDERRPDEGRTKGNHVRRGMKQMPERPFLVLGSSGFVFPVAVW